MRTHSGANGGRYYVVDEATGTALPSVTTIIGKMLPKDGIDAWRASIGTEEADRIMRFSANRGTFMHWLHEETLEARFVNGEAGNVLPASYARAKGRAAEAGITDEEVRCGYELFAQFYATDFYDRIARVVAQEEPVWSSLGGGFAGRLDLLVEGVDGKLKLLDFKSSRKPKRREWVLGYELQAAAYSAALKDRRGTFPDGAEIWVSCESGEVQEFPLTRAELLDRFKTFHGITEAYHKKYDDNGKERTNVR